MMLVSVEVLKEDNIDKQGQIEEFKQENAGLKEENGEQKSQIEELLNTIEDMKKKSNVEL